MRYDSDEIHYHRDIEKIIIFISKNIYTWYATGVTFMSGILHTLREIFLSHAAFLPPNSDEIWQFSGTYLSQIISDILDTRRTVSLKL